MKFYGAQRLLYSLSDLPHILLIERNPKNSDEFNLFTTKYVGSPAETKNRKNLHTLNVKDEWKFDDLTIFDNKIQDMEGREVVLALFNYLPYTIWNEVVSENC